MGPWQRPARPHSRRERRQHVTATNLLSAAPRLTLSHHFTESLQLSADSMFPRVCFLLSDNEAEFWPMTFMCDMQGAQTVVTKSP